jgi:hypothetical protein
MFAEKLMFRRDLRNQSKAWDRNCGRKFCRSQKLAIMETLLIAVSARWPSYDEFNGGVGPLHLYALEKLTRSH